MKLKEVSYKAEIEKLSNKSMNQSGICFHPDQKRAAQRNAFFQCQQAGGYSGKDRSTCRIVLK
jgi:hypothetical protein